MKTTIEMNLDIETTIEMNSLQRDNESWHHLNLFIAFIVSQSILSSIILLIEEVHSAMLHNDRIEKRLNNRQWLNRENSMIECNEDREIEETTETMKTRCLCCLFNLCCLSISVVSLSLSLNLSVFIVSSISLSSLSLLSLSQSLCLHCLCCLSLNLSVFIVSVVSLILLIEEVYSAMLCNDIIEEIESDLNWSNSMID